MKSISPPKHLRADTAAWFSTVVKEYELDSHRVRLLVNADMTFAGKRFGAHHGRVGIQALDRLAKSDAMVDGCANKVSDLGQEFIRCRD